MSAPVQVVIIGGSYGGIGVAHKLLEAATPAIKVTLINPSPTTYFNIAAPRILAKPASTTPASILIPISTIFSKYTASVFSFIQGAATSIDLAAKTVTVDTEGAPVKYDYLVLASGSTTESTQAKEDRIPWKPSGTTDIAAEIAAAQGFIKAATSVVVGGAGALGVEMAAEIAEEYPEKTVTLIASGSRVLDFMKEGASKAAEANLKKMKVTIVTGVKVTGHTKTEKGTSVALSDGETIDTALYIAASGVLPNNSFIPKELLDAKGWVNTSSTMVATGASTGPSAGKVFAIGDITTYPQRYLMKVADQVPVTAKNILSVIGGGAAKAEYKPDGKVLAFVPTGAHSGTAQAMGLVLFSFMVAFIKGKDFFVSKAGSFYGVK